MRSNGPDFVKLDFKKSNGTSSQKLKKLNTDFVVSNILKNNNILGVEKENFTQGDTSLAIARKEAFQQE
jgi:hypothetical protein